MSKQSKETIDRSKRGEGHLRAGQRQSNEKVRSQNEAADLNHAYVAAGRVACSGKVSHTDEVLDDIDAIIAELEDASDKEVAPAVAIGIGELALVA